MLTFKNTYNERKQEIKDFIVMMELLERKEREKNNNNISEFDVFFRIDEATSGLSYQSIINVMKSNVSLMIYNIIEFTVSNLLDIIYDKIKVNGLCYTDVSCNIQDIWRNAILKMAYNSNANFNTFVKTNDKIILEIIQEKTLKLEARSSLAGGNLDGVKIKDAFTAHGITINTNSESYRPDIFSTIKNRRNELAHGSSSFFDALKDDTIGDIKENNSLVISFLGELITLVDIYIENEDYKQPTA